jgi:hypothetical protein
MLRRMTTTAKPLIGRSGMNAVTWLLLALAAVCVVLAVAVPLQQLTERGADVPVTLSGPAADRAGEALRLPGLPAGTAVTSTAEEFRLSVEELPAGLRLLSQASTSLVFLSVGAGAWFLAMVLRSIRAGHPFDRRNPGRLIGVACALVLGGVVAPIVANAGANAVLDHLDLLDPGGPFALVIVNLEFSGLFFAAVVLAFAEAFRRGSTLADDVEGLV